MFIAPAYAGHVPIAEIFTGLAMAAATVISFFICILIVFISCHSFVSGGFVKLRLLIMCVLSSLITHITLGLMLPVLYVFGSKAEYYYTLSSVGLFTATGQNIANILQFILLILAVYLARYLCRKVYYKDSI